jgi:hypothetical protein
MHSDEYRRLYATCLTMAKQSNSAEVRARWLALATGYEDLLWGSDVREHRSEHRSNRYRAPEHRAAVNWRAA